MPSLVSTNLLTNIDLEIDSVLQDSPGELLKISPVEYTDSLSVPLTGSYSTPASLRIGSEVV